MRGRRRRRRRTCAPYYVRYRPPEPLDPKDFILRKALPFRPLLTKPEYFSRVKIAEL